ncbi:hypothetical protein PS662_04873 [Pseudomonas fluorescens]|uniref:Uncharacterized protein n=1 Tax=Pseudomonas fluorescens TaxID=294 RepID=A0A5E6WQ64_PSEFL|nr:hypothetical protein PS662_04873 [Pseudomonas fluorescens]
MATCQATSFLRVYISIPAATAANGFALTASHFEKRKVTQRSCPTTRHLALARCALTPALLRGSPRRAILGPARLNRHPCRFSRCAIPAFGQRGFMGRLDQNQKRGGLRADLTVSSIRPSALNTNAMPHNNSLWERACSRWQFIIQHPRRLTRRYREQARSHREIARPRGCTRSNQRSAPA